MNKKIANSNKRKTHTKTNFRKRSIETMSVTPKDHSPDTIVETFKKVPATKRKDNHHYLFKNMNNFNMRLDNTSESLTFEEQHHDAKENTIEITDEETKKLIRDSISLSSNRQEENIDNSLDLLRETNEVQSNKVLQ